MQLRYGVILALFLPSVPSFAACTVDDGALTERINQIQASYDKKFEERRAGVERESEDIKKDAPDPNAVEGAIGFELETKWKVQEVKLHIPEFRNEDKKIALNLPRVEMRQQTWIYHTPSVRMEARCINKPPETVCSMRTKCIGGGWSKVCTDIPECYTRAGGQMCTDIPIPLMQEQKTILGVPEVRGSDRQEVVLSIPVVEMKLQTWKVNVPEFTLKNVKIEIKKTQDRANALQQREQNAAQVLTEGMQGEIKKASVDHTETLFQCQERDLRDTMTTALNEMDANINAVRESIKSAQSFGAKELESSMRKALDDLLAARQQAATSMADSVMKLAEQKKSAIDKILMGAPPAR